MMASETKEGEEAMNVATAEIEEKVSEVPVEEKPQENPSDDVEDEDSLVIDETKAATNQSQDAPKEEAKDAPSPKAEKETSNDGTNSDENDDEEKEFEPTIDMMINDFDDERTLEEEEALEENEEDAAAEAEALEQEADMPLEELLKMYGYGGQQDDSKSDEKEKDTKDEEDRDDEKDSPKAGEKRSHDESNDDSKLDDNAEPGTSSASPPAKKAKSALAQFYEATVEGRSLRSTGLGGQEDDEDEEDSGREGGPDGDSDLDDNKEYTWKKTIMIGPSYQASVPNDLSHYDDTLPYENDDKLLWDPTDLKPEDVKDYLAKAQDGGQTNGGVATLPRGSHVRDDEQALYQLHQCGNNFDEALRRRKMNSIPSANTMSLWSEEECRAFELGLRLYGKDFHMIQQQKVRTRSVGELVQFYYLWKKTERHDVFANVTRVEKKKYMLHPGTTDYMDRFIDEQDPSRDLTSPNYHSLLYATDSKRTQGLALNSNNGTSNSQEKSESGSREVEASNNPSDTQGLSNGSAVVAAAAIDAVSDDPSKNHD